MGRRLLAVVLTVCLAGLVVGCSREVSVTPPAPPPDVTGQHAQQAQEVLDRLVAALRSGSRPRTVALAAAGAVPLLSGVLHNARALHIDDLSMRYVDELAPLDAAQQARFGRSAWAGSVQLGYRDAGVDRGPANVTVGVVFVPGGGGAEVASFGGLGQRSPLWLTGRLSVVRTPHTLLAVAGPVGRYAGLVRTALVQVHQVLRRWHGPLVVEVPRSSAALQGALQSDPGQYDNIAAVTTTEDGSLAPDAPVRVFVNPGVFDRLKQRGAQVVISHEATHVATGATFVSMPTWLLEGFADYVALAHAGVPVGTAAAQILGRVRRHGPPRGLPSSQDLDPSATGLGATYEEAWLACRFLGQAYGVERLIRFYDAVSAGKDTRKAFRSVLGTTQTSFVRRWRRDVARLASVTG